MALIKSTGDIQILREAGRRLATVLFRVCEAAVPGVSTQNLDELAERLIRESGDEPAFLGYQPAGAPRPFPATLCASVNDEIVHGIPNEREKILKDGDVVGLDLGLQHKGLYVDMAETVGIGVVSKEMKRLLKTTKESLYKGIDMARVGNHIGDIGYAIETFVRPSGFGIVEGLGGHGTGHSIHEKPYIANWGEPGTGAEIRAGMVLAIEPMLTLGSAETKTDADGYTIYTKKGGYSAHFERTILVTGNDPEILTQI